MQENKLTDILVNYLQAHSLLQFCSTM